MSKHITVTTYNKIEAMADNAVANYLLGFIYVGYILTAYEQKLVKDLLYGTTRN